MARHGWRYAYLDSKPRPGMVAAQGYKEHGNLLLGELSQAVNQHSRVIQTQRSHAITGRSGGEWLREWVWASSVLG